MERKLTAKELNEKHDIVVDILNAAEIVGGLNPDDYELILSFLNNLIQHYPE